MTEADAYCAPAIMRARADVHGGLVIAQISAQHETDTPASLGSAHCKLRHVDPNAVLRVA